MGRMSDVERMLIIKHQTIALLKEHQPRAGLADHGLEVHQTDHGLEVGQAGQADLEAEELANTAAGLPDEREDRAPAATSHIVVGKGAGAPGEHVEIEVLGQTHREVSGFGLAIGCNPFVRMTNSSVAIELEVLLGLSKPQVIAQQNSFGAGWPGDFVQVGVLFFRTVFDVPLTTAPDDLPTRTITSRKPIEAQIPTLMPIFRMRFKIPDDAKPGMKFDLRPGFRYGRRLSMHNGQTKMLYYPTEYGGRPLIRPELVSGWIDVT